MRVQVLERDSYLCQCSECKTHERTTLANEVDHIIPKAQGGTDDLANLQAINTVCHRIKSAKERGFTLRERPKIGLDGYPIGTA